MHRKLSRFNSDSINRLKSVIEKSLNGDYELIETRSKTPTGVKVKGQVVSYLKTELTDYGYRGFGQDFEDIIISLGYVIETGKNTRGNIGAVVYKK